MYRIRNKLIFIFATVLPICFLSIATATGDNRCSITGIIVDEENHAREGVKVTAYRADRREDRTESEPDGTYRIEFDIGEPIDEIIYERSGWIVESIYNLSGQKDHVINKVVYRWGTKFVKSQYSSYVGAVTKLYEESLENGISSEKFFNEVVGPASNVPMAALAKMPTPVYIYGVESIKKNVQASIYDFISKDDSFEIYKRLVEMAEIENELKSEGPYTLILPIDSAFSSVWGSLITKGKENIKIKKEIVYQQIIPGKYAFNELKWKRGVETLEGHRKIHSYLCMPIATDIEASNGIIHVVGSLPIEIEKIWWKK